MTVDWTAVVIGQTVWLALALAAGLVVSTVRSIASAAGREQSTPLDWLAWTGIVGGTVFGVGTLLFWSLRVGWALHQGTLFMGSAG